MKPRTVLVASAAALVVAAVTAPLQSPQAAAAGTAYTIWSQDAVPRTPADPDTSSVTVGVEFSSRVAGSVSGIRFFKSAENHGPHVGQLWDADGRLLTKVTFVSTSSVGWQTARFASPVHVSPSVRYVASYTAPQGRYAGDIGGLSPSHPKVTQDLTARRGVYSYGSGAPAQTYQDSNYYVDVLFSADDATTPDPTPDPTPAPDPTPDPTPAPTPDPTPAPPVDAGAKPGAGNTGVPPGTQLTSTGGMRITQANTVVDAKDISGSVVIEADNVTIRRSKIHGDAGDDYAVYVRSGSVRVVDSEISGAQNGIAGDSWSASRVNIHGLTDDGVKLGSNVTLEDSWIHDLTPSADSHSDGGQMQSGVRNLVVDHNTIDMGTGRSNSALFLAPDLGPSSPGPVSIRGNWLNGGNYTLYCVDGGDGRYFVDNISITSNRFGPDSQYGPVKVNVPVTASGNVMDLTGRPLTL